MQRISSPPLQPLLPLTSAQIRFLRFHTDHLVLEWRWHFCQTQLRACTDGACCTIWRDELEHLVVLGLMARGVGFDMKVTDAGRAAI